MHLAVSIFAGVLLVVIGSQSAHGQAPSVPNGSFELGQDVPSGWHLQAAGNWGASAHTGQRSLHADAGIDDRSWQSDSLSLMANTSYRLEGWLRCPDGEAKFGVDLSSDDGKYARSVEAPRISNAGDWCYVAAEFVAD